MHATLSQLIIYSLEYLFKKKQYNTVVKLMYLVISKEILVSLEAYEEGIWMRLGSNSGHKPYILASKDLFPSGSVVSKPH